MKKKIITLVLGITMALSIAACGNQNSGTGSSATSTAYSEASRSVSEASNAGESSAESAETPDGGWETNQGSTDPDDAANKQAKEAFEKAAANSGNQKYELIACLGSQVVAGTNYSFLVRETESGSEIRYKIAVVYEDLDGNASFTNTRGLLDIPEGNGGEGVSGGWSYNEGSVSVDDHADVKEAFEKAVKNLEGADYEPVAYIGSQAVSGTNYAVLCSVKPVTLNAERSFCLVTVYNDLDGNAEITDAADIDLSADTSAEADSIESGTESR